MLTTIADPPRARIQKPRQILARIDHAVTGRRALVAAAIVYLAYALVVTWPLATNISGLLSAPNYLEDGAGTASTFAYLVHNHIIPFAPAHLSGLNAPEGFNQTWALNIAQGPMMLLYWLLSVVFGAIAGGNVFMLLGFVGSGLAMFAFVRRLFGSRLVALFAGFAFAFYPFPVAAASVHYPFVHGWPMVLCVWGLIELIQRPDRRTALLAGAATAFAMWWNPYYELLGGFALATCLVICVCIGRARGHTREALRSSAIALLPVGALGVFFLIVLKLSGGLSSIGTVARPISQAYAFSAHLRNYLLPGPNSLLAGHLTAPYLEARFGIADVWDSAVYPGYIVVVLAIAGFLPAARALRANRSALADRRVVAVLTAGVLAAVAFVSSGPPTISLFGISVPLPSDVIYHITPTWQTFSRFVILLELALVIMMAAALTQIRRTLAGRRLALVFALIGLLLIVDLWASPAQRTVSTSPKPAYAWLLAHPGGIVADYPILPAYDPATAQAVYWGAYDEHPLFQGYWALTTSESLKLDLADLGGPQTADKLAAYGVRYIVVHRGAPGSSTAELRAHGYRPIVIDHHGPSLWRVPDAPAATTVDAESGFSWSEGFPNYDMRLLQGDGALSVHARDCGGCTGTVSLFVTGVDQTVHLTVRDQRTGAVITRLVAPRDHRVRVSVPNVQLRAGRAQLELQPSPRGALAELGMRTARLTLQRG
jgi:hypothetical protein